MKSKKDIDVLISDFYAQQFYSELEKNGYEVKYDKNNGTFVYYKPNLLPVEICEVEENPDEELLLLPGNPDFDVNLLAYNGEKLYDIANPDYNVKLIINNIIQSKALQISEYINPGRLNKIISKGYKVYKE